VQLKNWDQCGGKSGCKGATCTVAPWKGYCCPQGSKCVKNDDYYSNCQPPAGQSGGSSSGSGGGAPAPVAYKVAPPVKARKAADGERSGSSGLTKNDMFVLVGAKLLHQQPD
jgi:hypothetical protein